MAEQLPIVGHEYTDKRDGRRYVSNACESERLPEAVALTPHAPAQSALDELRREVERMTQAGVDISMAWKEANTKVNALTAEIEALRADRDRRNKLIEKLTRLNALRDQESRARAAIDTARASTDEGVGK